MRYRAVLLVGAPGSGKGTQGKILASIPGFFHCACGDVFRSLDLQGEIGRAFLSFSSRGELVPDEFTVRLWRQSIQGMELINRFHPETETLVLDGIPRNAKQAALLDASVNVVKVIHLQCENRDKLIERLRRRALKENRADDAADEVIRRRIEVYEGETRPLLAHYPASLIATVDAGQSQLDVLRQVLGHLRELRPRNLSDTTDPELAVIDGSLGVAAPAGAGVS